MSSSIIQLRNFMASISENLGFWALDTENREAAQHDKKYIKFGFKGREGSSLTSLSWLNVNVIFQQILMEHLVGSGKMAKSKADQIPVLVHLAF